VRRRNQRRRRRVRRLLHESEIYLKSISFSPSREDFGWSSLAVLLGNQRLLQRQEMQTQPIFMIASLPTPTLCRKANSGSNTTVKGAPFAGERLTCLEDPVKDGQVDTVSACEAVVCIGESRNRSTSISSSARTGGLGGQRGVDVWLPLPCSCTRL